MAGHSAYNIRKAISKDSWNWDRDDLSELINHSESMGLEFKASKIFEGQIDRVADELSRGFSLCELRRWHACYRDS